MTRDSAALAAMTRAQEQLSLARYHNGLSPAGEEAEATGLLCEAVGELLAALSPESGQKEFEGLPLDDQFEESRKVKVELAEVRRQHDQTCQERDQYAAKCSGLEHRVQTLTEAIEPIKRWIDRQFIILPEQSYVVPITYWDIAKLSAALNTEPERGN